jgi:predicted Fe-Mo cluster-binding NifX family protein
MTVVDSESNELSVVDNRNKQHGHGTCAPAAELTQHRVDAVACGGMGRRALSRLNEAGIRVFLTNARTPAEAVKEITEGSAQECTPDTACAGHHGAHTH